MNQILRSEMCKGLLDLSTYSVKKLLLKKFGKLAHYENFIQVRYVERHFVLKLNLTPSLNP